MDIRRLEAFCKVYEQGSFSKAGQELYLSQPTISAHVSTLEEELGVQLFDRMGRVILPTQAGKILYGYAVEAFSVLENARAEIQLLLDKVSGDLVVGGSTIPAHFLLPKALAGFSRLYPDVRLGLKVGDTAEIVRMVNAGEIIVGMVGAAMDRPELLFEPILRDTLTFVASRRLPGLRKKMTLQELLDVSFVMREKGSGTRARFEQMLDEEGIAFQAVRTALTVDSTHAVLQCALAGLGVGVVSRLAAEDHLRRGELTEIQVPDLDMSRQFFIVHSSRRHVFPVTRFFIDYMKNEWRDAMRPGLAEAS